MHRSAILRRLGSLSVQRFMREYWQRKPLLIRGALPDLVAPVDRAQLFALARSPDAESRLVTAFDGRWALAHGPIAHLPSIRSSHWTLLVQGVDLHDDSARALLSRFRFIPDARLDDLMVSYATDGGGVGPHIDSYDVFLLQGAGRRRWRISEQRHLRVKRGLPLNILAGFRASQQWVLEPGDMLYLPPDIAHEGVAVGESITYSIGFRAAQYQDLLEPWFTEFAEQAGLDGRYTDAGAANTSHAGALPRAMTHKVHAQLSRAKPRRADTERFLLRYLSEPKATTVFEPSRPILSLPAFRRRAIRRGITLDRRTRLIYSRTALGINGEWIEPPGAIAAFKTLADRRALLPHDTARVPVVAWPLLHAWYNAGWIKIAD